MKTINLKKYRTTNHTGYNYVKVRHLTYQNGRRSNGKFFELYCDASPISKSVDGKVVKELQILFEELIYQDNFNLVLPLVRTDKLCYVITNCIIIGVVSNATNIESLKILCDYIEHDVSEKELIIKLRVSKLEQLKNIANEHAQ